MSVSLVLFFMPDVIGLSPLCSRERLLKYSLKSTSSSHLTFFSFYFQNFKSHPIFLC